MGEKKQKQKMHLWPLSMAGFLHGLELMGVQISECKYNISLTRQCCTHMCECHNPGRIGPLLILDIHFTPLRSFQDV